MKKYKSLFLSDANPTAIFVSPNRAESIKSTYLCYNKTQLAMLDTLAALSISKVPRLWIATRITTFLPSAHFHRSFSSNAHDSGCAVPTYRS